MPQQRHGKTRRARRIGEQGPGGLRARAPTRNGGARRRPGFHLLLRLADANAQKKKRNAGGFRRPRQTQGRSEIQRLWRAENLDQSRAKTLAPRRINGRAQNSLSVTPAHQRQSRRIGAEFRQPHAIQPADLALQKILPRPKQRAPVRCAQSQGQTEANGGGPIGAAGRLHLMQARAAQPTAEEGVNLRRA